MKILIIDDSKSMRDSLIKLVQALGHSAYTAADGEESLEVYKALKPDLILLDVDMPGMSGYEVLKHIRNNSCDIENWIPIIFLTSNADDKNIIEGIESGGDDYILKSSIGSMLTPKILAFERFIHMKRKIVLQTKDLFNINKALNVEINNNKSMENQLAQSQKMEAVGTLAAGLAHEINTPTQYISDNIYFIRDAMQDLQILHQKVMNVCKSDTVSSNEMKQELMSCVEEIDFDFLNEEIPKAINSSMEGAEHIAKIIYSIKEFSHPGVNKKELVNINKIIEKIIDLSRSEWKYIADIDLKLSPNMSDAELNVTEINQVILNLIVNASHAIESKKHEMEEKGKITICTEQGDGVIRISIADTGVGIPDELHDKIFDPFFTTKEPGKGTGQGLAIIYSNVVTKMGGEITFETKANCGTTFKIELPIMDKNYAE